MKKSLILLIILICPLAYTGWANAYESDPGEYSGMHLATVRLNKSSDSAETMALKNELDKLGYNLQFSEYQKIEMDGDLKTGSFELPDTEIAYYGVKAGSSIAFFSLEGLENSPIVWSTIENFGVGRRGSQPGISHLSAWLGDPLPTAIPEPSTVLLVGFGLLGIFGVSQKMKKITQISLYH